MKKNRKLILKYLLLISVLMLMMLLCACRVRLTNNTEVASTITDEDGWMTESYQMRRDELGEPVAQRPIFKGFDSGDDEEDYNDVDYEPLDYDQGTLDEWDEPEEDTSTNSSSTNSNSSSRTHRNSNSDSDDEDEEEEEEKKEEEPKPDPVIEIIIELDVNGGNPIDPSYIKAVTGSTYRNLPGEDALKHPDKNKFFIGWFTEKEGGSLITAESTVESKEPLTLYAHWGKDYPFVLRPEGGLIDGKSDDISMKSKKGLYPDLPTPKKDGFHFTGWYLNGGKKKVESGQECTSKKPLVAGWVESIKYWEDRYSVASNNEEFTDTFYASDSVSSLVKGERKEKTEDKPKYLFIGIDDFNEENANSVIAEQRKKFKDSTIVVIPNGGDELRQVYKLILLKYMYGDVSTITDDDITDAASDLQVTLPESGPPYYFEDKGPESDAEDPEVKG